MKIIYDEPVLLDRATHDKAKRYANEMGLSISAALRQALNDWLDTIGEARVEHRRVAADYHRGDKVVQINTARAALRQA